MTSFDVRDIPNAGRGVVAKQRIPSGTLMLNSGSPSFHVIFKTYAKETCAECFLWDRGRSLPVRDHAVSKVFCSEDCQAAWIEDQGELGVESWTRLTAFVRSKGRGADTDDVMAEVPRPRLDEIDTAWREAELQAKVLRRFRETTAINTTKASQKRAQGIQRNTEKIVDQNALSYLLCGCLYVHRYPEKWREEVLKLAMDEQPYKSQQDLANACSTYLQLILILPTDLLPSLTPELSRTMVTADNHNAFGLRAGGEDSEEYMGYGVYPCASYFNHSCDPNVNKKRVGRVWEFTSCREIAPDEECCITYLGGDEKSMDREERQNRLKEVWGFDCACQRCCLEANTC